MKKSIIINKDQDIVHLDGCVSNNVIYINMEKDHRFYDLLTLTKEFKFVDMVWDKLMAQDDLEGDYIHISCDEESIKSFITSIFCMYNKTMTHTVSSQKNKVTIELPD